MSVNAGNQSIWYKFSDPLTAAKMGDIGKLSRQVGIYEGGFLAIVSNIIGTTTVSISPFKVEISDGTYQITAESTSTITPLVVTATNKFVVLRWVRDTNPGTAVDNWVECLAVATVLATDLLLGECVFAAGVITSITVTGRTEVPLIEYQMKVSANYPADRSVWVSGGKVTRGTTFLTVPATKLTLTPSTVNNRIDVIYIGVDGVPAVLQGTAAASPVAPTLGWFHKLAEVNLSLNYVSIAQANIVDKRAFLSLGNSAATGGDVLIGSDTETAVTPESFRLGNPWGVSRLWEYQSGRGCSNNGGSGVAWIDKFGDVYSIGFSASYSKGVLDNYARQALPLYPNSSEKAVKLYLGMHSISIITDLGNVYTSGYGANGEGSWITGVVASQTSLVKTTFPANVVKLQTRGYTSNGQTYALTSGGVLWAAGQNTYGSIGNGTNTNTGVGGAVQVLTGVADIAAASIPENVCVALMLDGTVRTVGFGTHGALGNGLTAHKNTWQTPAISDVVEIQVCSGDIVNRKVTVMALKSNGELWGWGAGSNSAGSLFFGGGNQLVPVLVASNVKRWWLHSNSARLYVLKNDNTLWAQGTNYFGELGIGGGALAIGTLTQVPTSADWSKLQEMVSFSCNDSTNNHTTIAVTEEELYGVGRNDQGQLGVGSGTNWSTFTTVRGMLRGKFAIRGIGRDNPTLVATSWTGSGAGSFHLLSDQGLVYSAGADYCGYISTNSIGGWYYFYYFTKSVNMM